MNVAIFSKMCDVTLPFQASHPLWKVPYLSYPPRTKWRMSSIVMKAAIGPQLPSSTPIFSGFCCIFNGNFGGGGGCLGAPQPKKRGRSTTRCHSRILTNRKASLQLTSFSFLLWTWTARVSMFHFISYRVSFVRSLNFACDFFLTRFPC